MTREATNRLLELVDNGVLDMRTVVLACVGYMSEDEVADMCHSNEFFVDDDDEDEDEDEDEDDDTETPQP